MNELALFAGAGGGILASILLGHRVICAVEIDDYCKRVLLQRQVDGILEPFPVWGDITTFDGRPWRGCVDLVSGGFPCQPWSVAGNQLGEDDERNLWPDTIRVIREIRPRLAFLENVPGLITKPYFGQILGDLSESGYDAEWCVLGAGDVGAPHLRKRLWILATDSECPGYGRIQPERFGWVSGQTGAPDDGSQGSLAHANGQRESQSEGAVPLLGRRTIDDGEAVSYSEHAELEGERSSEGLGRGSDRCGWWNSELGLGRLADGMARGMERCSATGNGQVPLVAATAFRILSQRRLA